MKGQRWFKLHEVFPKSVIDLNGRKVYFSHIEDLKAVCYEVDGTCKLINKGVWVEPLKDDYDEILNIIKEKADEIN